VLWLLKLIGGPGSESFLLFCLLAGLLVRWWRPSAARAVRWSLLLVGCTYLVLSLPVVANLIAGCLPAVASATLPASPGPVDALVVMDGDNRWGRARAGIEVNALATPHEIWVLGNGWLIEELSAGGVPRNRIFHDAFLATTRDQLVSLAALMARRPGWTVGVIVSRLQAARMARLLEQSNLLVRLIQSPVDVEPPTTGVLAFVPTYYALRLSRDAIYEHAALRYYGWRGWIK
jgi:uncharacterized SAM-binding protein YcdF (DUF218 family)